LQRRHLPPSTGPNKNDPSCSSARSAVSSEAAGLTFPNPVCLPDLRTRTDA